MEISIDDKNSHESQLSLHMWINSMIENLLNIKSGTLYEESWRNMQVLMPYAENFFNFQTFSQSRELSSP